MGFLPNKESVQFLKQQTLSPNEESIAASELRLAHAASAKKSVQLPGSAPQEVNSAPKQQTFSSLLRQARSLKQKAKNSAQASSLEKEANQLAGAAISTGTSELLQQAWYNAVESFGLTILYVNIHVLGRWIFGEEFFCKLGHEWVIKGAKMEAPRVPGNKWAGASQSILGLPLDGLGLLEAGVLIIVDLIIAAILLINFIELVFIAYVALHPVEALTSLGLGSFVDLVKAAFHLL